MSSIMLPFLEHIFIENLMFKINNNKDEWTDTFHTEIDNYVSYNFTHDNILIINEYAGGVFEAIKLYENLYGDFEIPDCKHTFYARLAFVSMYDKFYDKILDKMNDTDDDTNDDTDYETDDTVVKKKDDDYDTEYEELDDTDITKQLKIFK
jgi:hypothetical protein